MEDCVAVKMCSDLLDHAQAYVFGVPDMIRFRDFEIVHFVVTVPAAHVIFDCADELSGIEVLVDNVTKFRGQPGPHCVAEVETNHVTVFDHSIAVIFGSFE